MEVQKYLIRWVTNMGMKIITGYTGTRHVTAADDAGLHRGAIGTGDYIFDVGNAFAVSVVTNNLVKILDGELISKGQHARIATDDYEECIIENGTQTMKRNDLIVCRFITNQETGIQSAQVVVIKGTEGTTATDPVIMNTQYIHDVKLWRIPLNGLTVGTPVCLFKTVPSLNAINESLTNYVKIVPVKLYAKTTFAPVTSTDVYFAIPNVNGYKCLLGIGGVSENGFILPNRPSNTPKNGTIILSYTNKDTVAQTVEDLYCNMIFIRNP